MTRLIDQGILEESLGDDGQLMHPDSVRQQAEWVASRARHVGISISGIPNYAYHIAEQGVPQPTLASDAHFVGSPDETALYLLTLNAVNFGSGYFPWLQKIPGRTGYITIATRLKEAFERSGPPSPRELASLTVDRCAALFAQDARDPLRLELMGLFTQALNQLGKLINERYGGSASEFTRSSGHSVVTLIRQLVDLSFYRDVARYGGRSIPFLKRAQLAAADLAIGLPESDLGRFDDLDVLTVFADNLIPHVLHRDGILTWDDHLSRLVALQHPIPAGSAPEVELRACTVHAVELIKLELRKRAFFVDSWQLDYWLWNRGQLPQMKKWPRPRCRTVFY